MNLTTGKKLVRRGEGSGTSDGTQLGTLFPPAPHKEVKIKEATEVKKSKLDNPNIKKEVIYRLILLGERQGSIAKRVKLNQSQVSRWIRREDIKQSLKQERIGLVKQWKMGLPYKDPVLMKIIREAGKGR